MKDKKRYLFDKPRNVKIVLYTLYISCGILLLLDFIVHRHTQHHWEELLGFYSIYGFIGCSAIVIGSKWLRGIVERDEDYYTRDELTMEEEDHVAD
ncbi:MAG: hypothetical protein ACR2PB_12685 [Desulfocapsaceae bacterium]